ncbi:hypothetical protein D3C72_1669850 [compost metagenome]
MAPRGYQHFAGTAGGVEHVGVEAQLDRLLHRHGLGPRHLGEGLDHVVRIARVERDVHPVSRRALELRDAGRGGARLDGQQADIGPLGTRVVEQFGGAHGGAPCTRRHDAAAIVCKEDRVDQLRFAARKFGNKRHHDLVAANLLLQALQPLLDGCVHEFVRGHPLGQPLELLGELTPPGTMLVELFVE